MPSTLHQRRRPHRPHRSGSSSPAGATGGTAAGRFRPELHGLRGLAIALVVLYHVWFDRVSGGVDVFLFLSSFLLVGTFLRRVDRGEGTRPLAYWGRTFKRLLPPTAVVSLATLGGVYLILPADRWMPAITDAIGSLLHVENWVLIQRGVDYNAAAETGPSAFQHFWSLSIQGQVFLLWPLLIAAGVLVARVLRRSPRAVLGVVFALVLVASFAWSVHSTATQQEIAYFDTFTRLWEFAAGSLLGLLLPLWEERAAARRSGRRRSVPRAAPPLRVIAGWAGIAGLISCGLLIDVQGAFPGWIAAWPLAAAAVVLLVGTTGHRFSVDRILSTGPAKVLGDISYGLYLVHWPLLTLYLAHTGKDRAGVLDGLLLILASLAAAWLLTRVVDTPIRRWPWASAKAWRSGAVALTCLVLGLTPALAAQQYLLTQQRDAERRATADNPGARVLDPDFTPHPDADPDAAPLPSAAILPQDWENLPLSCEGEFAPTDGMLADSCRMTDAPDDAPVIVAAGNSRLAQTAVSLTGPAQENGWRLIIVRAPSCGFTPGSASYLGPECDTHNEAASEYIDQLQPEAVAVSTTLLPHEGPERVDLVTEGEVPRLLEDGTDVIALRDTPRLPESPVPCLEAGDVEDCTQMLDPEIMPDRRTDAAVLETLAARGEGEVFPVDLVPVICPEHACTPIIGNVHVMFDEDHLTATYMESSGDEVARQLEEAGFRW